MKVHKIIEGSELVYPKTGEFTVYCPVCPSIWMQDNESTEKYCQHLRFFYNRLNFHNQQPAHEMLGLKITH
jgi:hypothetical protein